MQKEKGRCRKRTVDAERERKIQRERERKSQVVTEEAPERGRY